MMGRLWRRPRPIGTAGRRNGSETAALAAYWAKIDEGIAPQFAASVFYGSISEFDDSALPERLERLRDLVARQKSFNESPVQCWPPVHPAEAEGRRRRLEALECAVRKAEHDMAKATMAEPQAGPAKSASETLPQATAAAPSASPTPASPSALDPEPMTVERLAADLREARERIQSLEGALAAAQRGSRSASGEVRGARRRRRKRAAALQESPPSGRTRRREEEADEQQWMARMESRETREEGEKAFSRILEDVRPAASSSREPLTRDDQIHREVAASVVLGVGSRGAEAGSASAVLGAVQRLVESVGSTKAAFDMMDTNMSGRVSADELAAALTQHGQLSRPVSDEEAQTALDEVNARLGCARAALPYDIFCVAFAKGTVHGTPGAPRAVSPDSTAASGGPAPDGGGSGVKARPLVPRKLATGEADAINEAIRQKAARRAALGQPDVRFIEPMSS